MSDKEEIDVNELGVLSAMTQGQEITPEEQSIPLDYETHAGSPLPDNEKKATYGDIVAAIKTIFDPEIPINVYDLGLIYDIRQQDNGDVDIDMTLTAPACPVAGVLPQQVADIVALVEGTGEVTVKLVWEPVWAIDRMSEEARAIMELI